MDARGQLNDPDALLTENQPIVPNGYQAGRVPESWSRKTLLAMSGIELLHSVS
jgi:hypothetical protein